MDLRTLLSPGGDPLKPFPYMLALSMAAVSGLLVVCVQHGDFLWAFAHGLYGLMAPFAILAAGWATWGLFGRRLPAALGLGLSVLVGCVATQAAWMHVHEAFLGLVPSPEKGYLYRLGLVRGALLWWGLAAAAYYSVRRVEWRSLELAQAQLAARELKASTAQARLQALQAQVEPHFLFNTLAHVKWLYQRDPGRGRHMLDRFLDYLQAALPRVRQSATTLEQELQLARAYLDLQQLRIGDRLAFSIDVPEEIAQASFPPLMLLTLVENAIKHGIGPQPEGGTIGIRAQADARVMRIEVRDTGAGLRQASGSGIGLANVRARLAALFGAGARLVIEPNLPHGVVAAIEIPR